MPSENEAYKETFATWNKLASLYQEKFMDLDIYNESYDLICSSITKKKAKILELGCGPGNITKYLLSKRPDFVIHGTDIAPNMIELAKKNNPGASFAVMDSRNIRELQTKFDGIVCGFCLPYLSHSDGKKLISDAADLLVDNGLIYLSFVEGAPAGSGFKTASNGNRAYFYYYDLGELKAQLMDNRFGEIKVFKVEYGPAKEIHTILTARKK